MGHIESVLDSSLKNKEIYKVVKIMIREEDHGMQQMHLIEKK